MTNTGHTLHGGQQAAWIESDGEQETRALCAELQSHDERRAIAAAHQLQQHPSPAAIAGLRAALGRPGLLGLEASRALADMGRPAFGALLASLESPNPTMRWHAAKALTAIAAPESVPALIAALGDEDAGVRWEAVHALAAVGLPALAPLLHRLCAADLSIWQATGAQRVLRRLAPLVPELHVEKLIRMLDHTQQLVSVPIEAYRLLQLAPDLTNRTPEGDPVHADACSEGF